ncbi:hypothetical protein [Dactylosporangium sp. NPDC048998]|uniref:hypothetical protein n=1 Tax=Dactylosporangium sp. NPDC048998 TaxID=3363976 RepID=UPI003712B58F
MRLDPRPGTVTAARLSLLTLAVTVLVSCLLGLLVHDEFARACCSEAMDQGDSDATSLVLDGVVSGVSLAVIYGVPALLLGRPYNWGRVVAWVACVLSFCWVVPGLSGSSPTVRQLAGAHGRWVRDAIPTWYVHTTVSLAAAGLVAAVVAAVLLALPPSNGYFRRIPD